jgi:hypothetical protein
MNKIKPRKYNNVKTGTDYKAAPAIVSVKAKKRELCLVIAKAKPEAIQH